MARVLTGAVVERARAVADGEIAPATPRAAATVLLLRDGADGLEVLLMRRHSAMAFAAGMWAFPGGSVEDVDTAPGGPAPQVAGAVRETLEETGVLLAAEALVPWARWVTPTFEPRRYDTHFFLAALPDGQEPAERSGEADTIEWLAPAIALGRTMLPPTAATLASLVPYGSVREALAAGVGRSFPTVEPGWTVVGDELHLIVPEEMIR